MKYWGEINRILLGLLMLVAGLLSLFVAKPSGVESMLLGIALFSWAPLFWAWVLILGETLSGIAILAKWKLEYATIPPVIILVVAALTVYIHWSSLGQSSWTQVLLHLAAASNYILLGCYGCRKKR